MDRYRALRTALRTSVLQGPGATPPSVRQAAAHEPASLASDLAAYATQIHQAAYRITDAQVAALSEHHSDDEIFDVTIAAAVGKASLQLEHVLALLDAEPRP